MLNAYLLVLQSKAMSIALALLNKIVPNESAHLGATDTAIPRFPPPQHQ